MSSLDSILSLIDRLGTSDVDALDGSILLHLGLVPLTDGLLLELFTPSIIFRLLVISFMLGLVSYILDDVINMLADNLDPAETPEPKNTLHLAGSIDNRLPVTLQISPSFPPTQVIFTPTTIAANTDANELPETRLQADDLRTIVRGITVNIPLVLEKYYPGKGFGDSLSEEESQVVIHLHLIKRGALKFDL